MTLMRKISCIVNTSAFQAQVLTEVISMLLEKWEKLLKLILASAEEDNTAVGYFKWVVNTDHLAHEVLYAIGTSEKASEIDEEFSDAKTLGDVYRCIKHFVHVEILSEDYIKTLILRYNNDKSDKNRQKLEKQCFKTHHKVFYHIMDILKLVEYINFKTPTLSVLCHFLNDKAVLGKLKNVFSNIWDILGDQQNLKFYNGILGEVEKRIKIGDGAPADDWKQWITKTLNLDERGNHEIVQDEDDDDDQIANMNDEEIDETNDSEDMYIVLSNINEVTLKLFTTWEKIFILNSKNSQIKDWFSNLMHHRLGIWAKQNEFKNQVKDGNIIEEKKVATEDNYNIMQLLTVSSILPFLDISLPDTKTNTDLTIDVKNEEHDYLYSIQEFDKVLDLMSTRMETSIELFEEVSDDSDIKNVINWLKIIYKAWYKTYKEYSKSTFHCDDTTKDAFKVVTEYIRRKDNLKLFNQFTGYFYPSYGLSMLEKYLKKETNSDKETLKIKGWKYDLQLKPKFEFLDFSITVIINLMMSQSLSN